ncbi:hypothetical protein ciss_13570 [Carboxydothermus islandicus]|uniref:Lipoprotein n=1 Tax=Carboxydothermus islandicus TaxID=661089 RepID=A0A1L8D2V1_9THEO|nr:hypothetical protein [Carboxydothermus islandicus]GAV25424.1 hypothetical protein ciss_13570 [Carboxydothermus islandicus]
MWVIEKRAYYFFVALILLSLITGCTETKNTTKKPVTDNRTVKNKVYKADKSESPELSDLEKNLKELATKYVLAKYKGDEKTFQVANFDIAQSTYALTYCIVIDIIIQAIVVLTAQKLGLNQLHVKRCYKFWGG